MLELFVYLGSTLVNTIFSYILGLICYIVHYCILMVVLVIVIVVKTFHFFLFPAALPHVAGKRKNEMFSLLQLLIQQN